MLTNVFINVRKENILQDILKNRKRRKTRDSVTDFPPLCYNSVMT